MTAAAGHSPRRHLEWRIRLFGAGAIVGLIGMWANQRWMVNVAIAVLALGVALRFVRRPEPAGPEEDLERAAPDDEAS